MDVDEGAGKAHSDAEAGPNATPAQGFPQEGIGPGALEGRPTKTFQQEHDTHVGCPAGEVVGVTHEKEDVAHAKTLRVVTERIRHLSEACTRAGITLERLPEEIGRIRTLLQENNTDAALERIREIRLPLLAEILLQEPDTLPPAGVENPPAGPRPEAVLSERDRRAAHGRSTAVRTKRPG